MSELQCTSHHGYRLTSVRQVVERIAHRSRCIEMYSPIRLGIQTIFDGCHSRYQWYLAPA